MSGYKLMADDKAITEVAYLMQFAYGNSRNQPRAVSRVAVQLSVEWRLFFTDDVLCAMWQAIDAYVDMND